MHKQHWKRGLLGGALASLAILAAGAPPDLKQGWSDDERDWFYYTTQGSLIMPRDWMLALERDNSQEKFLSDGLARFGYLPGKKTARNPDQLPVGFAVDKAKGGAWIGMTCAACHTSEIARGAVTLRIEGAPGGADMYELLAALERSARKTVTDDKTFERFAAAVLGTGNTTQAREQLRDGRDGLRDWSSRWTTFVVQSTPKTAAWGPRRLDAFNMIFNRVGAIDLGIPNNSVAPDAPVSYPFLWGTSWHDKTQWNGAVPNDTEMKRLGRNAGQALGVFGTIDFSKESDYLSSLRMKNLVDIERQVARLKAPEWPASVFGVPETKAAANGATLYKNNCAGCHTLVPPQSQSRTVTVTLKRASEVGTDPAMTTMAATRALQTGMLEGRFVDYLPLPPFKTLGPSEPAAQVLNHSVVGAIVSWIRHLILPFEATTGPKVEDVKPMFDATVVQGNYKARPLNGIWATAPYLHNGSVRTLRQLLLPPAQREASFMVGSREFDPDDVGFGNAGSFRFDTTIPGNLNKGHVYGTGLSDPDRDALLQFLKTL